MSVGTFVWRPRAKMVGIVDLFLSAIALVVVIVVAILSSIGIAVYNIIKTGIEQHQQQQQSSDTGGGGNSGNGNTGGSASSKLEVSTISAWMLWLGVVSFLGLTGLQVWGAIKLVKMTDLRKTSKEALSGVKFWLFLNIILLLISVPINIFIYGTYVWTGVTTVLRLIMMLIVYQFMTELKVAISAQSISKVSPL